MKSIRFAVIGAALAAGSASAQAATLIHAYDFNGSAVVDSVGGVNGTLVNGATVSGGMLNLDGVDDFTQLSGKIIPTNGAAYSVYIKFQGGAQNHYYNEMISQGSSGGPGFYIGTIGDNIRLTDIYAGGIGVAFPSSPSDLLVTTQGGSTKVYLGGVEVFSSTSYLAVGASGTDTRFGTQFGGYNEYFKGALDDVRVYSGVATYAEAAGAVPEPASWAMMIAGFGLVGSAMRRRKTVTVFA